MTAPRQALFREDVCDLEFPDEAFDTVLSVSTFCSVPRPIVGIRGLRRVLRPDGRLLMLEHVRSGFGPLGIMMDLMSRPSPLDWVLSSIETRSPTCCED